MLLRFAVFAKHLQAWPLEQACERVKAAGFDGLDLTVRPGGYVDPVALGDAFEAEFRRAVRTVQAAGLAVPLTTTGLTSAADPAAEKTLRIAGELGIREAKLHYWPCPPGTRLPDALEAARRELSALADLGRKSGVRINLHNHSGDYITCQAQAVGHLLADHPPEVVGAYLDPAHFTLEGGLSGWRFSLEQLAPRASLLAIKDGKWVDLPQGPPQERRWVPVGTGNVRWKEVLGYLKATPSLAPFSGWASIHGEYQGRWSWRDLTTPEVLDQCTADLRFIQGLLETL